MTDLLVLSPFIETSKRTSPLMFIDGVMHSAEPFLCRVAPTAVWPPKIHEAGSDCRPLPLRSIRVPPSLGPPAGTTRDSATARMSKNSKWTAVRTNVAPSPVTARGSLPPTETRGEAQVMLRPSGLTVAWTEPCLPKRTRASKRSSSRLPYSVRSVPPATGAPSGEMDLTTTSAPGCPKNVNGARSSVLVATSPLRRISRTVGSAGCSCICGLRQRASLGPSTVASVSTSIGSLTL